VVILADIPIHPEQASSIARQVDLLHFALTGITLFFTVAIFSTILFFMLKYRRRPNDRPGTITNSLPLEITWTIIPSLICVVIYIWSSGLYFANAKAPDGAMEIFVTGKQWMWKVQHPEGRREINELHVPVGRPVKLTMTSEDVIHDFFIPAFRIKKDVLPGRYSSLWFTATETGQFHLFCAQYCGAFHAGMGGWVIVMSQSDYDSWLNGGDFGPTMEAAGESLFQERACAGCHVADGSGRGPSLAGLYDQPVHPSTGGTVTANEAYLREAILHPNPNNVTGYKTAMPSYEGQLTNEQLLDLIAYIRSLGQAGKAKP
jgi:cytochrome c oxidase subunit II